MPRPKKKTASPYFLTRSKPISNLTAHRLGELLGYEMTGQLRLDIEKALGMAIDGAAHLDNIPRAADYRQEFEKVRKEAFDLANKLGNWSYYYAEQFAAHGADVYDIERALGEIVRVAGAVIQENEGKTSKGAPSGAALTEAVLFLSDRFRVWDQGPAVGGKTREVEFIREALVAGRAIPSSYSGIPALLRRAKKAT